jgi:hypothetical protein
MRPLGDASRRYEVTAAIGGDDPMEVLPLDTRVGTTSIEQSGQGTQYQMGAPNIVLTGLITSDWEDVDNLGSTPVGAYDISGNVASQIHGNHVGYTPGIAASLTMTGTSDRTYFLADDSASPAMPITLVESFQVFYEASPDPTFPSNLDVRLDTPSVGTIQVIGGPTGINQFFVGGGLPIPVGASGSIVGATVPTAQTSTVTYSSSTVSATFTITTVFPNGLPSTASTTPPNTNPPPNAVPFRVTTNVVHGLVGTGIGSGGSNPNGATGQTTATTHYEAHFYT